MLFKKFFRKLFKKFFDIRDEMQFNKIIRARELEGTELIEDEREIESQYLDYDEDWEEI